MIKKILTLFTLIVLPFFALAQEQEEDETKMVREIVPVQVDKSKFAAPPAHATEDHSKKGKKKHHEVVEPPPADTSSPLIPAPVSEISKRADHWLKAKTKKYTKSNGSNTGSTISVNITFPFVQKILNPENEVDGKISMDVVIDAKEGKYRYTIKNIKHVANKQGMSGGDIYEKVPEAGSMKINDQTWKHIKSATYADIQIVVDDLKAKMKEDADAKKKDDW